MKRKKRGKEQEALVCTIGHVYLISRLGQIREVVSISATDGR